MDKGNTQERKINAVKTDTFAIRTFSDNSTIGAAIVLGVNILYILYAIFLK